ncbi:UNVERIFIED_CONTAM: hypothetical protein Scaly_0462500 [Sesamum calycinum]|uniref:Zinc knuckle CX2CX4HX4C domain-containing protein n=1 Tax=Sesamum calycinum TaxID=2727403 RepID=A0AAW2SG00_9LAMI
MARESELGRLGSSLSLTEEEEAGLVFPTGYGIRNHWQQITVGANDQGCGFFQLKVKFKEVELDSNGEAWGSSIRIRVAIDITKPLKRVLKIRTVLGDDHLVTFTYERLLNLCYLCGCLGHLSQQFEFQLQEGFQDPGENPPYGNWLRAAVPSSYRGRNGVNLSRSMLYSPCRPNFVSYSSLQSLSQPSSPCQGSSIFEIQGPSKVGRFSFPLLDVTNLMAETAGQSRLRHESLSMELSGARGALDSSASRLSTFHERLDRVCANLGRSQLFPETVVQHVPMNCSDHVALVVRLRDNIRHDTRGARMWRFEAAWLQWKECEKVVTDSWTTNLGCTSEHGISAQLACCQDRLKNWSKTTLQTNKNRVKLLDSKLRRLLREWVTPEVSEEIARIRLELEGIVAHDETRWKQQQRKIRNSEGIWVTMEEGIQQCISSHFGSIYASNHPQPDAIAKGTEHLRVVVDARMGEDLLQPYTASEVKKTLFQMAPLKSPGPDGLPQSSHSVKKVLEIYRRASGQEINFSKSSVAFSRNTDEELCLSIDSDLTIRRENKMELYLGLPSRITRSKKNLFATLRDRIRHRVTWWNEKFFSQAGKEVLIKSVLQAIPTRVRFLTASQLQSCDASKAVLENHATSGEPTQSGEQDVLIRHYSRNGVFSVRSAYHLACSLDDRPYSNSLRYNEQYPPDRYESVKAFTGDYCSVPLLSKQRRGCFTYPSPLPVCSPSLGAHSSPPAPYPYCFWGAIARDNSEAVFGWLAKRFDGVGDGELAEAEAAREAVSATLIHKLQLSGRDLSAL